MPTEVKEYIRYLLNLEHLESVELIDCKVSVEFFTGWWLANKYIDRLVLNNCQLRNNYHLYYEIQVLLTYSLLREVKIFNMRVTPRFVNHLSSLPPYHLNSTHSPIDLSSKKPHSILEDIEFAIRDLPVRDSPPMDFPIQVSLCKVMLDYCKGEIVWTEWDDITFDDDDDDDDNDDDDDQ